MDGLRLTEGKNGSALLKFHLARTSIVPVFADIKPTVMLGKFS